MKLCVPNIFIFLAFNIYCGFVVGCQDGKNDDSFHAYNLINLVKKPVEHISTSQNLKLLSKEDIEFINGIEKLFPLSINPDFWDFFSESTSEKCVDDLKFMFESLWIPGGWSMKSKYICIYYLKQMSILYFNVYSLLVNSKICSKILNNGLVLLIILFITFFYIAHKMKINLIISYLILKIKFGILINIACANFEIEIAY